MTVRANDSHTWFDSYRSAFAPVLRMQEEGLKVIEQLARFQYGVAGDCLESGLAQAHAALTAKSPAEFLAKQAELGSRFSEELRVRAQEFMTLASDAQGSFSHLVVSEATAKTAKATREAAKSAS